jgi:hypothetical protein
MAPRPLGAIKVTPRCLHSTPKHTKSTPSLQHSASTPSSNLREIRALVFELFLCDLVLTLVFISCACVATLCFCVCILSLRKENGPWAIWLKRFGV